MTTRKDFFTVWLGMSRLMVETAVILMAEDDENQVVLMRRVFKQARLLNPVHVVKHGEEAIAYLSGPGKFEDRIVYPFPNLLLLDLKMPVVNGFEVLEWVRAHPDRMIIPTLVFSSSVLESDMRRAYELGASSYLVKPTSTEELRDLLRVTHDYWSYCHLPQPLGKRCN